MSGLYNVIQIDAFSKLFDGFSIGSNDLMQLTIGIGRDSELIAFDYDERDAGVKEMIRLAVEGCRRDRRHPDRCGQAPSDCPENGALSGRDWHRVDESQPRRCAEDDTQRAGAGAAARPCAARDGGEVVARHAT